MNRLGLATLLALAAPALAAQELPDIIYELADVETVPILTNAEELQAALDSTYPPERRASGQGATVAVAFVLGADGVPRHLRVAETTDEAFDSPTRAAIARLRFSPATVGGRPVAVHVEVPLEWPAREPVPNPVADAGADAPPEAGAAAGTVAGSVDERQAAGAAETDSAGRRRSAVAAVRASAARAEKGEFTGVPVGTDVERVYTPANVVADGRNAYELSTVDVQPRPRNIRQLRLELERLYPADLRRSATRGIVQLRFRITETGEVDASSIVITSITDVRFAGPTVQAIQVLRFSPARVDGRPVKVWVELPIQWEVDRTPVPPPGSEPWTPRR